MSIFDGTWRPDPQRPDPDGPPDDLLVDDGFYECRSCQPPYRVPADGQDHPVEGSPRFDAVAVTVVDDRTVRRVTRRDGRLITDSVVIVSADGRSKVETQTVTDSGPIPLVLEIESRRVGGPTRGAHPLSGRWQVVELDLVNHDEDTTYRIVDDTLTMQDRMGRSFVARLDGTPSDYRGDPRFTSVSVRWLDDRTIEETDRNGNEVVLVMEWRVEADGATMHVRFDDRRGHVMEQYGRKLS